MTGSTDAHDRTDHTELAESGDLAVDDYPQGMLASPSRTRL